MHISINTAEEISDLDRQILGLLAGGSFILGEVGDTVDTEEEYEAEPDVEEEEEVEYEEEAEEEPEPEPAPRTRSRKKPEPEPEPEPMAEEEVEEEEAEAEADDLDEMDDEDLLALAIKKATEMVSGGQAAAVREALDEAGASRVRELNADNVRDFFRALDA